MSLDYTVYASRPLSGLVSISLRRSISRSKSCPRASLISSILRGLFTQFFVRLTDGLKTVKESPEPPREHNLTLCGHP